MNTKSRIIITGGHSTPAIACIEELIARNFTNLIYIGQKKSILFDKNVSSEYRQITEKININFKVIYAGKISKYLGLSALIWFIRIPIGFIQAFWFVLTLKPKAVLTFGSHVGIPIVFWAWVLHIKIIAHEQTVFVGKANRLIQKFATKVCVSWESSLEEISSKNRSKFILTGNPIRSDILNPNAKLPFELKSNAPILFITGGNQGAHVINEFIFSNLEIILRKFNIIHQTGANTIYNDFEIAKSLQSKLSNNTNSYIAKDYLFSEEMASVMNNSNIIISRSGANAITEILIHMKKCILIPIPNSKGDEQFKNAKLMESIGLALIVQQKDLNIFDLSTLDLMHSKPLDKANTNKIKRLSNLHLSASKKIVEILTSI